MKRMKNMKRERNRKVTALLLASAMTAGMLAGCGQDGGTQGNAPASADGDTSAQGAAEVSPNLQGVENELTMQVEGEVDSDKVLTTLINCGDSLSFNGNPWDEAAGPNWSIKPFMYDTLAHFSPLPERTFECSLLESYTYEDKVLTLKLLPDLKWSDGSVLDAEDVLTNYYCQLNYSSLWGYLDTIEKKDDLTLELKFCSESPLILNLALGGYQNFICTPDEIYSKWADQFKDIADNERYFDEETNRWKYTDEGTARITEVNQDMLAYKPVPEDVVCSGPYVISSHNTSEIMFSINEQYRKKPLITSIRGLNPGDSQAFLTAILAGEYTIENGGLNTDTSAQIDGKFGDTMRKVFVPELSQIGYTMNTQIYPLDKLEVRQAISKAIDRQSLLAVSEPGSFSGSAENAGLIPSFEEGFLKEGFKDTLISYSYDPEGAAQLLESIGWSRDGSGKWVDESGTAPAITIATIGTWPSFMMTGEAIATMLTEFGLNIDFQPMDFGVWSTHATSDEKMMVCTFVAGAPTYAYPWECFNDLFNANVRTGWQAFEGKDKIFTDPVTNEEYNTTEMLTELFNTTDEARRTELIEDFMTLSNHLCGYVSVIEKTAPTRIYDTSLHLAETEMNAVQANYYYFGDLNTMIAKMLADDLIYFVKE